MGQQRDNSSRKARGTLKKSKKYYDDLAKKAPKLKDLQANLTAPELQGLLDYEALTKDKDIAQDSEYKNIGRETLAGLEDQSHGETQESKSQRKNVLRELAATGQSQRKAIDQEMAQRGTRSSGAGLLAKLQAQESGNDRAAQQSEQLLSRIDQTKRQAMLDRSNLASDMSSKDIALQSGNRDYRNAINEANLRNKMNINQQNLTSRQNIANNAADIRNQQALQNVGAYQTQFSNRSGIANSRAGLNQQIAQSYQLDPKPTTTGAGQLLGTAAGAYAGYASGGGFKGAIEGGEQGGKYGANLEKGIQRYADGGETPKEKGFWSQLGEGLIAKSEKEAGEKKAAPEKEVFKTLQYSSIDKPEIKSGLSQYIPISKQYKDGGEYCSDGSGDIVEGDSYSDDRVDAKLNSGEMVLNTPQQNRLMDIIKGKEDLKNLPDRDIVEGVPKDYLEDLKNKDTMSQGFKKLLEMLGK